ncbi:alpha/beta hydrolase [Acinetobacter wanghuae]|uniref:alpha/beta hydrolase n=1 Tax=Acinetobacter wanghuae TaxID=2662362 RepID=UPI003AF475D6
MNISPLTKQLMTERFLKTAIRAPSRFNLPPTSVRMALEQLCKLFPKADNIEIRSLRLAGLKAEEIKPQQEATQLIFHIHGGAFFLGSMNTHRAFMTQIAARTQMQVLHVDYPLAPESMYPEALDALFDVYETLLNQGIQSKDIILSGDSCGANLALALALKIQKQQRPQPSGLILLSPFLDLTLSSPSLRYNNTHDALLSIETLEAGIDYYVPKSMDRSDPEISPFFADLSGLPPIHIQVGSKEILLDDAQRFKEKAEKAKVDVEFKIYTGMWHNFQMFSAWFDEAKQALADLSDFAHRLDKD